MGEASEKVKPTTLQSTKVLSHLRVVDTAVSIAFYLFKSHLQVGEKVMGAENPQRC